ncbi:MAG: family 10 glycosylhydrolase [Bacteroidaceae bacterium]|nr:family 10 glycosylhydrolase [Bacteroidaceae bacterium]
MRVRLRYILLAVFAASSIFVSGQDRLRRMPKREFRGAWIQCVNGQFQGMSTESMQQNLLKQLNTLKAEGTNVIIFQVRPECDALYESSIEPWSKFLTGVQGRAPSPYWDPLQWMVKECHKRDMELHAWINPYRAKTKNTTSLTSNHVAKRHPEWVFSYDGLLILNPAYKECRDYICEVTADIVSRYDIDGLHIDDYFYPYPVAGQKIPDSQQYNHYRQHCLNTPMTQNDWRRENVNLFIKQLAETVKATKPWVKFGVSPFGIYRNKRNDPKGSETNGLQNYDDLYADCLRWTEKGWVDYLVPQLYWQIGHKSADYETLIRWWNLNVFNRPLIIGEDIERTVKYTAPGEHNGDQMEMKFGLQDELGNVKGSVLWYSRLAVDNHGNYGYRLQSNYWRRPVLQPSMTFIDDSCPDKVKKLKCLKDEGERVLFWLAPEGSTWKDKAVKYVVYRFMNKEKVDLEDASKIVAITTRTYYKIPPVTDSGKHKKQKYYYYVTALNRLHNESKEVKVKVKY